MGVPRLLCVVAHPDDETFGCGSILLHAAARGARTAVCCATRGEQGSSADPDLDPDQLGVVREAELRAAAEVLGVSEVSLLGWRDSGMDGPADEGTVVATPVELVARSIAEVIARFRPHVVVTLDGADGHRDHAHVRDATLLALGGAPASGTPNVYLHALPRSLLRRWADHMRVIRPDSPYLDVDELGLGTPDADITTTLDVSPYLEQRRAAIACHASQVSPYSELPPDLERAFLATDHLRRVVPPALGAVTDDGDLFAGIDLGPQRPPTTGSPFR